MKLYVFDLNGEINIEIISLIVPSLIRESVKGDILHLCRIFGRTVPGFCFFFVMSKTVILI